MLLNQCFYENFHTKTNSVFVCENGREAPFFFAFFVVEIRCFFVENFGILSKKIGIWELKPFVVEIREF